MSETWGFEDYGTPDYGYEPIAEPTVAPVDTGDWLADMDSPAPSPVSSDWLADMDTPAPTPIDTTSWTDDLVPAPDDVVLPAEGLPAGLEPSEVTDILVNTSPDRPGSVDTDPYVGQQVWNSGTGEWDTVTSVDEP